MFSRRSDSPATVPTTAPSSDGDGGPTVQGKGRPTPSRREAEAARRARVKSPRSRKASSKADRAKRAESSHRIRAGMKEGDERYLPKRDKGSVRRFVRDFVDARFSVGEVMIPLMLLTLVLGYSGNPDLARIGNSILLGTLVIVIADCALLRFRLRRELRTRFPESSPQGTSLYAFTRALQMRFMRIPKTQVRIGQQLRDSYR